MKIDNQIHKEPIAIVGIGCRLPGSAANPKSFWELLCRKGDAITEVPNDRWDIRRFYNEDTNFPVKMNFKRAGFLDEKFNEFDPEFFHISPREAKCINPLQRLLLELSWEAMEDGGIVPDNIRGLDGGVFIGAFANDWQLLQASPYNSYYISGYSSINFTNTILSARLSHFFDFKGPSLTLDTACSASLVALHLACQSIWQKECSFALVGGVSAMLNPLVSIAISQEYFLSPDAQCRSFDADAKGYVRGEGGGVVILKPLGEALKDSNTIYAVIRGTAVNQDGHTAGGITQPAPESQRRLIEEVLKKSHVSPDEICYIEAHATGTAVGDPIEANSIGEVLNACGKRTHPCYLGALKSNIGHLEAGAGVAGLIKAALCLKHKQIPANLHFLNPNPHILFDKYCLKIPTELQEFPRNGSSYYALINSFGYGGTNANAILQRFEPNTQKDSSSLATSSYVCPFSAKSHDSLKKMMVNYGDYLKENCDLQIADIAHTLTYHRSAFNHRMSVAANSSQDLLKKIQMLNQEEMPEGCVQGKRLSQKPLLTFVYSGMGPQWWGMGRNLLENSSLFFEIIEKCDRTLLPLTGWSLLEELVKAEKDPSLHFAEFSQVANYSIQVGLTHLIRSWGIEADFIVGHSVGEVAAAYASGAITLEEGLKLSYHRSRLQATRQHMGTMLVVGLSMDDVQPYLTSSEGKISVAAENSQNFTTLSGEKTELENLAILLEIRGVYHKFLKVDIAYHSHQMEGLEEDVLATLNFLSPKKSSIPFYSTVYGDECKDYLLDNAYWWRNIRKPVLFASAIKKIIENRSSLFLEIGPHPVLGGYIKEILHHSHSVGETIPTLNRKKIDNISLQECIGHLFVSGYPISWKNINQNSGRFVQVPTYPWQKKSCWVESDESLQYRLSLKQHVMLSRKLNTLHPTWRVEVNKLFFPWLEDHVIDGNIIFPGAGFVEAALAAFFATHDKEMCCLEEIVFHHFLSVQRDQEPILEVSLDVDCRTFKICSLPNLNDKGWVCHATGKWQTSISPPSITEISITDFQDWESVDTKLFYDSFFAKGLGGIEYGLSFQKIKRFRRRGNDVISEIHLDENSEEYVLHPTLLDAAFQTMIPFVELSLQGEVVLPVKIEKINFYKAPGNISYCQARCTKSTKQHVVGNLFIFDENGNICVEIIGAQSRIIFGYNTEKLEKKLYQPQWVEAPLINQEPNQHIDLIGFYQSCFDEQIIKPILKANQSSVIFDPMLLESEETAEDLIASFSHSQDLKIVLGYLSSIHLDHLASAEIQSVLQSINLVKAIQKLRIDKSTHLTIITRGTQFVEAETASMNLFGSSLWGLSRVIRNECSNIYCSIIDIELGEETDQLIRELHNNQDVEIALRGKNRYIYKLIRNDSNQSLEDSKKWTLSSPSEAFSLKLKTPGLIESLYYEKMEQPSPEPTEVGVQVYSASLNFKDLLKVLGMLDQNVLEGTYYEDSLGMECVGTIVSVGKKVKNYKIGDQVCITKPGVFQSYITASEKNILPIPDGCTLDDAAIYIPCMTVIRALKHVGKLKRGEKILIHSGSGAVGLFAIQYALHIGARIFATAGNEEKRIYLKSLGVEECFDSRSDSFVDGILKLTDGKGVDVVLNSLGGELLIKSFSLLAPLGRFLEIGKKDVGINTLLPMKAFDQNTQFSAIDLDKISKEKKQIARRCITETLLYFKKGIFKSIPVTIFKANEVVEAFQHMARAKHVGKIMLKFEKQIVTALSPSKKNLIDSNSSYLITGGLSGFGLMTAKWLVKKGARHLILLGRSGASTKDAQQALEEFRMKGINVKVAAVDVTNFKELAQLFNECQRIMPEIKGVIHSAMILKDALLVFHDAESTKNVLHPKIEGCINLHRLSCNLNLDFFVLFSSLSSIIGNPGQADYAAANSFLDQFCHYRKTLGLPGITINWGALRTGVLIRNEETAEILEKYGIYRMPMKTAFNILEKAIIENKRQLGAFDVDWNKLMTAFSVIHSNRSLAFSDFKSENSDTSFFFLQREFIELDHQQQISIIITKLKELLAKFLGTDPTQIDTAARLNTFGIDSLMFAELQGILEENLGVNIPLVELIKAPTIEQLAQFSVEAIKRNISARSKG